MLKLSYAIVTSFSASDLFEGIEQSAVCVKCAFSYRWIVR